MRIPVLVALAVPIVLVSGAAAVFKYGRPAGGEVRTYYIAADEVAAQAVAGGAEGTRYVKARYREYTDATFAHEKPRPAGWDHLAFLGPLVRASVGDTVRIVFRNRVGFPVNVHPDAVLARPADARATLSASAGSASDALGADGDNAGVPPGGERTYTWAIGPRAGPGSDDHGSVLWLYHSHTGHAANDDDGLVGPIIVYKAGALR